MATRLLCFQRLNEQIFSQVEPNPDAEVLELGCGSGRNIPLIVKAMGSGKGKVWAIDFNFPALELANENLGDPPNVIFKKDNMRHLSFKDNTFDCLFDIFAGTYLPLRGWQLGIKEAFRVMRPGAHGYFLYFIHGKRFSSCFTLRQKLRETIHNPLGVFWALHLKLVRGLNVWDKFIEKGEVVYPKEDEFVSLIEDSGGAVEVMKRAFLGVCMFVKAKKL